MLWYRFRFRVSSFNNARARGCPKSTLELMNGGETRDGASAASDRETNNRRYRRVRLELRMTEKRGYSNYR